MKSRALASGVSGCCYQRAVGSEIRCCAQAEQQEANIFNRREHQQALETALREHEQRCQQGRDGGGPQHHRLRGEQARRCLNCDVQLAERGNVDDGDDDPEDEGWHLVGQRKQPEEHGHSGQLDHDSSKQKDARPIHFAVNLKQIGCDR